MDRDLKGLAKAAFQAGCLAAAIGVGVVTAKDMLVVVDEANQANQASKSGDMASVIKHSAASDATLDGRVWIEIVAEAFLIPGAAGVIWQAKKNSPVEPTQA